MDVYKPYSIEEDVKVMNGQDESKERETLDRINDVSLDNPRVSKANDSLTVYLPDEPTLENGSGSQSILDIMKLGRKILNDVIEKLEHGGWSSIGQKDSALGWIKRITNRSKCCLKFQYKVLLSIEECVNVLRDPKMYSDAMQSAYDGDIVEKFEKDSYGFQFEKFARQTNLILFNRDYGVVNQKIQFSNGNIGILRFSYPHDDAPTHWYRVRGELEFFIYLKKLGDLETQVTCYQKNDMNGIISDYFVSSQMQSEVEDMFLIKRHLESNVKYNPL